MYMEIQNLPMFRELSRVFCSYKIESWQTVDFWDKVKLLEVVDSNVNYQSVYRLILRLVKDGYLTVDVEKSRYGQTTYTEAENLHDLRSQFCIESTSTLQELNLKKEEFECGVCQASCPISYAANTTFLSNSLLSFDGFSQTSLTGFQLRTERFFQRSGLASLAVS